MGQRLVGRHGQNFVVDDALAQRRPGRQHIGYVLRRGAGWDEHPAWSLIRRSSWHVTVAAATHIRRNAGSKAIFRIGYRFRTGIRINLLLRR